MDEIVTRGYLYYSEVTLRKFILLTVCSDPVEIQ